MIRPTPIVWAAGALIASTLVSQAANFEQVQDILETRCVECHQTGKTKGNLLMETREGFLKGGDSGAAIQPGDVSKSELLKRIHLPKDDEDAMPPAKSGPPLTEEEQKLIGQWVTDGAPWPDGLTLASRSKNALPRWDAPADPQLAFIEAYPKSVSLETAADFHRVIVIARFKDSATHDITRQSKLTLGDPSLATLTGTTLLPKKDGTTTLKIEYRGLSTEVAVAVKDATKPRPVSFQLDVMPVLTAAGCNTGSCHGSARGQDGFHLSLYGFDPKGDFYRLTTEMAGRRVNLAVPEESLMITKAIGAVPHTGGKLLAKDSASYNTLVEWIRNGAEYDADGIPQPTGITVEPSEMVLKGGDVRIPITVRATYSDGTDRDVSTLSGFSTSNDNSVTIDKHQGIAASKNRGEAFLLARFHTFNEGAQAIVVPADLPYTRPEVAENNYIDKLVHDKLDKLRIIPSGLCSDEEFIRRAFIDIIGELPSVPEREAFLASNDAKKREALVDQLLSRKEFTEMWVMKWAELLQIRTFQKGGSQVSYKAALGYYNWLRERIASNMPFNELVRQLLSAEGGTFTNPATNYYQLEEEPLKTSENVAQVFMGTRIQCAQCHNHPFDRWTMEDYYGFAAFFAQVKRKPAEDPRERIIFDGGGEVQHLVTKQNVPPKFLGGARPEIKNETRREEVAKWLTSTDNPWFARNVSNIVWSHFLGAGIVEPVDDVRVSNPPSNPALLDELTKHFVSYNYDFRKLVRDICTSRTYQLASATNETNVTDDRNFSHAAIRRVRAEVLLDCISQVTNTPNKFKGLPLGARAVQIADGNTTNYFLTTFGRASRATACSCEVKMEPNLSQALHLLNGDTTQQRVRNGKVVENYLKDKKSPSEVITNLYLSTLGRAPTDPELNNLLTATKEATKPEETREVLEDIFWALLNSKEFIFNH
ncbi:PSD1 domain-containing protein [Luteolibacter ambystomatis]|uniref:PSD1 domain-containing protein n=1 Tax=Luteolibacter ambystomatis TaxID=2824561 RepID=A0A975J0U7_9BACT|nr:PSD1 and planctomycete cytochrome C domain-containing protein [Luteolibacter ambystomatis]QUE51951.1 PSD1 domain-containing protein [Luteolibacter ambystomatis]